MGANKRRLDAITDRIIEAALGVDTMKKVARQAAERVRTRTRVGKGVDSHGKSATPLPKLKDTTVDRRKRDQKAGNLSGPGARPARSSLTRTGEMLEALTPKWAEGKAEVVIVGGEQNRKAREVQDLGFTFMNLSRGEIEGLAKIIQAEVRKKMKT